MRAAANKNPIDIVTGTEILESEYYRPASIESVHMNSGEFEPEALTSINESQRATKTATDGGPAIATEHDFILSHREDDGMVTQREKHDLGSSSNVSVDD